MTEETTTTRCQHQDFEMQAATQQTRQEYYSLDENELLTRKVIDGGHEFCAIYLPSVLTFQVLLDFRGHMQPSKEFSTGKA